MKSRYEQRLLEIELKETRFWLKETIRRARQAEQSFQKMEGSGAFELGTAMLDAMKSPSGIFRLPSKLLGLLGKEFFDYTPKGLSPAEEVHGEARKKRLLLAGHDLRFFGPIADALERSGKFEVRRDRWHSQDSFDQFSVEQALSWSDVVVAEWCLGNAVWYSQNIPSHKRLIIRFHLRERASRFPDEVRWDKVDKVVFVGPHILQQACSMLGVPEQKATFIPNMVPVARYYSDKKEQAKWTIGMLGYTPMRKRLDRVLDVFESLWNKDNRWRLRIKGSSPEQLPWMKRRDEELKWYAQLNKRIDSSAWKDCLVFDPPGDDVPSWLKAIGYLLSPSDFESFHMAVGEAMASGAIVLIWPWLGSADLWPDEFVVFDTNEAVEILSKLPNDEDLRQLLSHKARNFVKNRYGSDTVSEAWDGILA